jgi:beta-glucosidase
MVAGFEGDDIEISCSILYENICWLRRYDNWKDRTPSIIRTSFKTIRSNYLPSSNKSGVKSIMISSGEINGTPIHASKHLITDILKTNWVFEES